jgi:hypothetical protein
MDYLKVRFELLLRSNRSAHRYAFASLYLCIAILY